MEISIAKVINETVSLSTVFFPISGKLSLDLMGKYTYEFTSDYKFLPGSSLTVRDEATLVINESCDLILYESYPVKNSSGAVLTASNSYYAPYFDEKDTVELSLYGNMIVNGGFAGHIDAKSAFASVDFSGARTLSVTSAEGNGDADTDDYWGLLNGSAFTFTKIYDVTLSANGDIADSPDYTSVKNFNKDNEYIAIGDDDGYVWTYKKAISISYDSNGGLNIPSKSASVNATDGLTLADEYMPTPIRDYYEFCGWYLDPAMTQPASGETVYSSTTLYAKWTAITYTLKFVYTGDIKPDSAPPESQTFNAESTVNINIPSDSILTFTAWYTDSAFKNELTSLTVSGKDIAGYAVDNVVTLYGLWTSIQHTVNFIEVKYADELDGSTTRMITPAQINNPLPTVSYSKNTGREYYFDKWMLVREDGTETEITTYSFVDAHATESITYTVKAIYKQKVSLTVDYGSNELSLSNPTSSIWLKPGESFSVSDITTGDNNVNITKYSKGWACEECSVNGTTVTINSDAPEGATATATAEWGTKHKINLASTSNVSSVKVTINGVEYSSSGAAEEYWIKPTDETITLNVYAYGSEESIGRFYKITSVKIGNETTTVNNRTANVAATITPTEEGETQITITPASSAGWW